MGPVLLCLVNPVGDAGLSGEIPLICLRGIIVLRHGEARKKERKEEKGKRDGALGERNDDHWSSFIVEPRSGCLETCGGSGGNAEQCIRLHLEATMAVQRITIRAE